MALGTTVKALASVAAGLPNPIAINTAMHNAELQGYFHGPTAALSKTILPNYRFFVTIDPFVDAAKMISSQAKRDIFFRCGPMPIIKHWHLVNVTIPQYDFQKETMYYGPMPRSFPILNFDGFELRMEMEEDTLGTISHFIAYLQKRIVDVDGLYSPPNAVKLDRIIVQIEDQNSVPVMIYTFHNCFFLQASDVTYDYGDNQSVKYQIVFGADFMSSVFPKRLAAPFLP